MSREELRYIRAESFTSGYVMRRYDDGQRSEGDARSIFGLSLIFAGSKWKRRHEEGEGHQSFSDDNDRCEGQMASSLHVVL